MVEVHYNKFNYKALLGNNMFQYCFGRILAEELGLALRAEPIPGFPHTGEKVSGRACAGPEQVLTGQQVDLDAILRDRSPRRIVLRGWFQRHEYYRPHRDRIREWLAFDPAVRTPAEVLDIVVHVRRADYVPLGWALPFSYYEEALQRLQARKGRVCILTDDRRDPFFRRFARWQPVFSSGSALEDLRYMALAPSVVMSQSTFSWWPTFLGDPRNIVCPVPAFGAWSERGEAREASLVERDRFTCIECREPYRPSRREAWHQTRRALWRRAVLGINRRFPLSLAEPPA